MATVLAGIISSTRDGSQTSLVSSKRSSLARRAGVAFKVKSQGDLNEQAFTGGSGNRCDQPWEAGLQAEAGTERANGV